MKKKLLIVLLLTLSLLFASALTVAALDEDAGSVYVCLIELSDGGYLYNGSNTIEATAPAESEGYVHYDAETQVLTLHDAVLDADTQYLAQIYGSKNLNILLEGTNTIYAGGSSKYGINAAFGNVNISGQGTLLINSHNDIEMGEGYNYSTSCISYGINAYGDVNIESGTVKIFSSSDYCEAYGIYSWNGNIYIGTADLTIEADGMTDNKAVQADYITFAGGHSLTNEEYFSEAEQTEFDVSDLHRSNYLKVVSGKLVEASKFGAWINGVKITSSNSYWKNGDTTECTGTSEDYNAFYDRENKQLILNDAVIDAAFEDTFDDRPISVNGDISIILNGTNTMSYESEENSVYGIAVDGDLTMSGNGSLSMSLNASGFLNRAMGIYSSGKMILNESTIDLDITAEESVDAIASDYVTLNDCNINIKASSAGGEGCQAVCGYDDVKIYGGNINMDLVSANTNVIYSNENITVAGGHTINDGSELFTAGRTEWYNNSFGNFSAMTIENGVITKAEMGKFGSKQIFVNSICIYDSEENPGINYWKNGDTTTCSGTESDYNAYYDPETLTLYLQDAEITNCTALEPRFAYYVTGDSCGIFADGDIIINLKGDNKIENRNKDDYSAAHGVFSHKTITFTGDGKLSVDIKRSEYAYAIDATFGITLEGKTIVSVKLNDKMTDSYLAFCTTFGQGIKASGVENGKSYDKDGGDMDFTSGWTITIDPDDLTKPVVLKGLGYGLHFTDVQKGNYFYEAVKWAVENDITSGKSETSFAPYASCTRAEFVTFLWKAAGQPVVNYAMPFTDIDEDAFYAEALRWAASEGIVSGTSATTFAPNASITRAQTVTFLWKYAKAPAMANMTADGPAPSPFTDVATDAYYYSSVLWAKAQGVTSGKTDTTFGPDDNCLRGQVICFLFNYMNIE